LSEYESDTAPLSFDYEACLNQNRKKNSALNWIVGKPTTNQSSAVSQLLCIQFSNTERSL